MAHPVSIDITRQLDTAQQITHIGSWEWEIATGKVTWSDELYRIYGLAPRSQEITFEWFLTRLHPEDRDRVAQAAQRALRTGGRFGYPERIIRPDGSVRELETLGEVLVDERGHPRGLIGTCRDVTEQRRREERIRLYADIVAHVQIGLTVWKLDDERDPASLRLLAFNLAAVRAGGVELSTLVGRTLPAVFPHLMTTELPAIMAAVGRDQAVRELTDCRFSSASDAPSLDIKVFALPDRSVGLALEDVSERVRGERMQAGERRALEMLAAGAPLRDVLSEIVRVIESLEAGTIASVLLLDDSGTRLTNGAAPGLPDDYNAAIDGAAIGPSAGSCGTAAFLGQPVFVTDIENDPLWQDYRELARAHGLRACWSHPIVSSAGRVLGTFALYYREPRQPEPPALALIGRATHVAAIAIERRRLDDQLRALEGRMEAIREEERTGIAREIHDELGQALTALKLDIAWLARRMNGDQAALAEKLADMTAASDRLIDAVRRISAELRPVVLDDLGLAAALEWQAEDFTRRTGTPCIVDSNLGQAELELALATAIFRIFQEALTNVTRHAAATEVRVTLRLDRGNLHLEVADDGVGLPPEGERRHSLGLLGMDERARRLGGQCTVTRREPRGTLVSLAVPYRAPAR